MQVLCNRELLVNAIRGSPLDLYGRVSSTIKFQSLLNDMPALNFFRPIAVRLGEKGGTWISVFFEWGAL